MKVKEKIKEFFGSLPKQLIDKDQNKKIVSYVVYGVLFFVAIFMTVFNLLTNNNGDKTVLTMVTGAFGLLCLIDFFIALFGKLGVKIASVMFSVETVIMFTYFLVYGTPEGFSIIWICLLPAVSMLFYDRIRGTILSFIMLLILIFVLWIFPNELLVYQGYTATLKMRFPVLFVAFYFVAFFLETLRSFAYKELQSMTYFYRSVSIRDQLTNVFNREGLHEEMERYSQTQIFRKIGVVILDIDFFKRVNDTYGHSIGDKILQDFARILTYNVNGSVCRWGGEEFAIVYFDDSVKSTDLERVRSLVESRTFIYDEVKVNITISMGVFETCNHNLSDFNDWAKKADEALYRAKESGRNKVVYY